MEHAYNSGCKRTHSHQIQLDGGGEAQIKLYRYSPELQMSKKHLKHLQQCRFVFARHLTLCVLSERP